MTLQLAALREAIKKWQDNRCQRLGHKERRQFRKTFRYPSKAPFHSVADDCKEVRYYCARCGKELVPWIVTRREYIQSLSLSSDRMEELHDTGILVRHGGH